MFNGFFHSFQALRTLSFRLLMGIFLCAVPYVSQAATENATPYSTRVGHASRAQLENNSSAHSQSLTTLTIPEGETERTYTFPTYTTPFTFNAIGLKYTGSIPLESVETYITATTHTGDTVTRHLEMLGSDQKSSLEHVYATYPVIMDNTRSFTLSIVLRTVDSVRPSISDFEIIYINTLAPDTRYTPQFYASADTTTNTNTAPVEDTPPTDDTATSTETDQSTETSTEIPTENTADPAREVTTTAEDLEIVSRADWGADESYRYTVDQEVIWPEQYVDPEVFIVHHTAGSDGGDDPEATVRAIYYFHAVVYGWGDIGYNYLIDAQGHVYEGRNGGDGVVGGHAYNSTTNVGYNEGSIGISLLGCYEADSAGCITINDLSTAMKSSLAALITKKAKKLDIDVAEETVFHGSTVYRLIGHRDVASTLCPGSITEDYIPTLRILVADTLANAYTKPFRTTFISAVFTDSDNTVIDQAALIPDTDYTLTLSFKNTGYRTWKESKPFIKLFDDSARKMPSTLKSALWPKAYGRIKMNEEKVRSDETATFTVPVHTPVSGTLNIDTLVKMYIHIKKIKGSPTTLDLGLSEQPAEAE